MGHTELVSLVIADFQLSGIGSKTGAVACADAGTEVAANGGGTDEHDAGFLFLNDGGDGLSIRLGHVILQEVVVNNHDFVGTMSYKGLSQRSDVLAKKHGDDLLVVGVSQLASLTQKLKSHILQFAFALLGKHVNVFIF